MSGMGTPDFLAIDSELFASAEPLHRDGKRRLKIAGANQIDPASEFVPMQTTTAMVKQPAAKQNQQNANVTVVEADRIDNYEVSKIGPYTAAVITFTSPSYEVRKTSKSIRFYSVEKRTVTLALKLKVGTEFEILDITKESKKVSLVLKVDEIDAGEEEEVL